MTKLAEFASTDRQRQIVEAVEQSNPSAAARQLGVSRATVRSIVARVKLQAAKRGWSPDHDMTRPTPETHYLKGTSTLYGDDGEKKLQWVKTTADQEALVEFSRELAESISTTVKPFPRVKAPRKGILTDRMVAYPIGDAHVGLYAWNEDAGGDWDCSRVEDVMRAGFGQLLAASPDTEEALLVNLGDWFHTDTLSNTTRASGHHLDVDTRWARVARVGVRLIRALIDSLLLKHKKVRVINEIGNHDEQTSVMLSLTLEAAYEKEPRVSIDTSPDVFHWHEFGNCLIGVHHGHKCKPGTLYQVMAEDQREACGRCAYRYWYTGHIHHAKSQDVAGQQIESFRTIIPGDNYAHSNGYRAPRSISSITLHREFGECGRQTVNVEAIRS